MRIGPHTIDPPVILAPMAGVTDRPFRSLCRRLGAGLVISEMTTSDPTLLHSEKSRLRRDHQGEQEPISVQIAGSDPENMADCARFNVEQGAQIIDINMGCPAKKVCRADAGSALLRDPQLVRAICGAVVAAVSVPVTLKIRTGYTRAARNGIEIARIAEDCGIAALSVHGRTREDRYEGEAEYETVAAIKQTVKIPVIVNGDIRTPHQALDILAAHARRRDHDRACGAGAPVDISRGGPFSEDWRNAARSLRAHRLAHGCSAIWTMLHAFYGEGKSVRIARKHIQWYCQDHAESEAFWKSVNQLTDAGAQRTLVADFFGAAISGTRGDIAA